MIHAFGRLLFNAKLFAWWCSHCRVVFTVKIYRLIVLSLKLTLYNCYYYYYSELDTDPLRWHNTILVSRLYLLLYVSSDSKLFIGHHNSSWISELHSTKIVHMFICFSISLSLSSREVNNLSWIHSCFSRFGNLFTYLRLAVLFSNDLFQNLQTYLLCWLSQLDTR